MPDIFDEISLDEETPQGDIFDQITYESTPTPLSEIGRHVARTGSRITESLLGLPSDVLQTAQMGARGLEKVAGKVREKIGLKPLETKERPPGLPGSEELREISTKLFGEKVTAQSPTESFIDDIVSDAAVLAIPVKGKIPFRKGGIPLMRRSMPFIRSIGTAVAANLAAKGAEQFGFEEKGQTAAKIGTFFLAGLAGKGSVKKYWNHQYKLSEKAIPRGSKLDATKLDNKLDRLHSQLRKGGIETPSQKFVEKPIKDLQKIIHEGEMRVEDAVAAKKKINELRSGLFDEVKGKGAQKYARTKINDVANFLDESLEKYGKENPKFYEHYKNANQAYAGFHQSKRVGRWINRAIPFGKLGKGSILLLETIFKPATLKVTVPAITAFKGGELLTRMFKNPTLKRFYGNLMKDSVKENSAGFIKNLNAMEKELKKSDPDIFDEI